MASGESKEYVFFCPQCSESLEVNDSMRDALLEKGCVICGTTVTTDAFTRTSSPDSA